MAKFLAISDIHFHSFKQHSELVGGLNSRFIKQMEAFAMAIELAKARECRAILIPGDLFEVRGSIKPSIFNRVTLIIKKAIQEGLDVVLIPGNHDMEHFNHGDTSIDSWRNLAPNPVTGSRCCVIQKPGGVIIADTVIVGIPYTHNVEEFKATFASMGDYHIILIHQGIDDFSEGTYPPSGLSVEWLNQHQKGIVLCGHYHNKGIAPGVVNVGALMQHRASDEGQERGAWVIDTDDLEAPEFIPVKSPEFVTVEHGFKAWKRVVGNFVRVRATSSKEADKLREKAIEHGAGSVVVQIEKEFKTAHEAAIAISKPRMMLQEFLAMSNKYKSKADKIMTLFDRVCTEE